MESIAGSVEARGFSIEKLLRTNLRGKDVFFVDNIEDELCIRSTCRALQSSLRLSSVNRHNEVKQLMSIIGGEKKRHVFRTDVSSFFESINLSEVIERLESDGFRNLSVIRFLFSINKYLIEKYDYKGVPRGLGLSSLLADYVMRDFDKAIVNLDGVLYYSRYVDDIIIVSSRSNLREDVQSELASRGFLMNKNKTNSVEIKAGVSFDYLGYELGLDASGVFSKIASSKMNKVKKRICLAIQSYLNDRDFNLLLRRLQFLSSTVKMEVDDRDEPVYTGLSCVYSLCKPECIGKQLVELDVFLRSIMTSRRYGLSRQLRSLVSLPQLSELKKISFKSSFDKKINHEFDVMVIADIKKAWKYV